MPNFLLAIPRPEGPDSEKCPCRNLGKFCQAQILISCGWIFGGRLRPGKGTQVPANSLKQFREPRPQILISSGWIFGGRLRPDKGTQVPENSLKDEDIAPSWKQLFPLSETLRARSARAFDNVTRVKPPYIEKIRGANEQLSQSNKK